MTSGHLSSPCPATVDALQAVVDRSLLARIEQLERDVALHKSRADVFAGQLREARDTLDATERCMDIQREATARLRPLIRHGDMQAVLEAVTFIQAQRPEGWRPE